eukprot:UN11587
MDERIGGQRHYIQSINKDKCRHLHLSWPKIRNNDETIFSLIILFQGVYYYRFSFSNLDIKLSHLRRIQNVFHDNFKYPVNDYKNYRDR